MIVYVESNFILELAYLQEDYANCERILDLGATQKIELILPAFAVGEPYFAWVGRKRGRARLHDELTKQIKELGRSEPYAGSQETFQDITKTLLISGEEEKVRLDDAIRRTVNQCDLIPIDADIMNSAIEIQIRNRLSPQDSIIYASVLSHLVNADRQLTKIFVTKNSRDFSNPDVVQALQTLGCGLFTNFGAAYGEILRQQQDG